MTHIEITKVGEEHRIGIDNTVTYLSFNPDAFSINFTGTHYKFADSTYVDNENIEKLITDLRSISKAYELAANIFEDFHKKNT